MSAAEHIARHFNSLISISIDDVEQLGTATMPFPIFPVDVVRALLEEAILDFQQLPNVLYLEGSMHIVGDIHGNIKDLLRIFATGGHPSETTYLFLGDYVDRGQFSVEVIVLLLALAVTYKNRIYLLRGNHEYEHVNAIYGFKEQLLCLYGNQKLYSRFQDLFNFFPIAAVVNNTAFCVHGGLSPCLREIHQLDTIDRTATPVPRVITDMMWSDPSCSIGGEYQENSRGSGCEFGLRAVSRFLANHGFKRIIRAHQFQEKGISKMFDGKLITVFSTSNYKGQGSNKCGLVRVIHTEEKQLVQAFNLNAINLLNRNDAHFRRVDDKPLLKSEKTFGELRCLSRNASLMGTPKTNTRARPIVRPLIGSMPMRKVSSLTPTSPLQSHIHQKLKSSSQKELPDANEPMSLKYTRSSSMESFSRITSLLDDGDNGSSLLVDVPPILTGAEK